MIGEEGSIPIDVREGRTNVLMEFTSSGFSAPPPQDVRTTRLMFEHVVEYAWTDFEFHRDPYGIDVGRFALVKIENSPAVTEIRATGRYLGNDLRHYRITFDDHGTYDIICEELSISYGTVVYQP
jgi:hypothetical protein